MAAYRKNRCSAPHLFTIADRAYNALLTKNKSQSIIISGESGAGKTEATKIIMQYLAKTSHTRNTSQLEQQVLSSNPLLESFGNARTLRNDNSSRFGKFIQIKIQNGHISGATIRNYLLEKTRIVQQIEGERNYHIFYQLLSDQSLIEELGLHNPEGFNYLSKKYVQSKRDERGLVETKECLKNVGLSDNDQKIIFQIVAGVLHLGNVAFVVAEDNEKAAIADEESQKCLEMACKLLGMDHGEVSKAILTKMLNVGGKTITQDQNVAQAMDKRDAFAKLIYSSLFLWLVSRINSTIDRVHSPDDMLSPSSTFSFDFDDTGTFNSIGVLDIYGFEQFDVNGFEQLLINYANEKLQRHFNKHLFEVEQELYSHEGVDWTYITFNDNKACLELIEGGSGSVGILGTLDDAWSGMGSGNEKDVKFVSQLHQFFGGVQETSASVMKKKGKSDGRHENFRMPKFANDKDFIVIHYAGEVRYTAHGFVEKNVESLSNELKSLGMTSTSELCRDIFTHFSDDNNNFDSGSNRTRSTIRGVSIASQFKSSLQSLVGDLEETEPHYIRCVKPNLKKTSNDFDAGEVLRQLRYAGMLEAIRIRREGYALREPHESFYNKFHILFDSVDLEEGEGIEHLVKVLSKRLSVTSVDWQIGHSKIFLRRELAAKLNALMSLRIRSAARTVGRFGRRVAHRRAGSFILSWVRFRLQMYKKHKELRACVKIQSCFRKWKQRKTYKKCRVAIITIQSTIRMGLAMKALNRLRDPYRDMTFGEVKELYKAEIQCLECAVATKDYELAADIEKNIIPLKEALEKKRPLSRALIDKMIEDVEIELKGALAQKRYNDCPSLQQKLDELVDKRKRYPTIDELRQKIIEAENAVDEAAANRDFTGAAARQVDVENAKRRLSEALAAETENYEEVSISVEEEQITLSSRSELEEKVKEVTSEIRKAIDGKNFKLASSLQGELEKLETQRQEFPTVAELEQKCSLVESEMEEAIAAKNFSRAAILQEEIDSLQKCIQREKSLADSQPKDEKKTGTREVASITLPSGEVLTFISRSALDLTISKYTTKVNESATKKKFTDAKINQEIVDQLENLRPLLPTLEDVERELKKLETKLQNAIEAKDFVMADNLQKKIDELRDHISQESKLERTQFGTTHIKQIDTTEINENRKPHPLRQEKIMPLKRSAPQSEYKTVSKLRPKKPLVSNAQDSVLTVAQMLANKRNSASIVIGPEGNLFGIVTDTDITRRLVARELNASETAVAKIMTGNPAVVSIDDSAMEALGIMVENHFRHLPVVDDQGSVVGVLDIAKCLNDAISKLERAEEKKSSAAEDAVKQMAAIQGAGGQQAAMLTQLLAPLMAQAFGSTASPTLRSLLAGKPATIVSPGASLKETATVMAEAKKAALVVESGKLVGIFGFKDMMSRVVAKELPLEHTAVREVMTPDPESVSPDITVIEALQILHDNKFLNLPVCEQDGTVCGLVGVMDLILGCGGAEGWRSLFSCAMEFEQDSIIANGSNVASSHGIPASTFSQNGNASFRVELPRYVGDKSSGNYSPNNRLVSAIPESIPNQVEFKEDDNDSFGDSLLDRTLSYPVHSPDRACSLSGEVCFKLTDSKGHKYLIRSEGKLKTLFKTIVQKVDGVDDVNEIRLKFIDEEGDEINITSDECLTEAIIHSRKKGDQGVKLILSIIRKEDGISQQPQLLVMIGGIASLVALGITAMTLYRRSK